MSNTIIVEVGGSSRKAPIPRALREQVWLTHIGRAFEHKCLIDWCQNNISVFNFHVAHNIPESRGGATDIGNLHPICARCNQSMGAHYTIKEWNALVRPATVEVAVTKGRWCC